MLGHPDLEYEKRRVRTTVFEKVFIKQHVLNSLVNALNVLFYKREIVYRPVVKKQREQQP